MPNNLERDMLAGKNGDTVAVGIARMASLVEAVYILFWGRKAIDEENSPWTNGSHPDRVSSHPATNLTGIRERSCVSCR
jgi:hypothetical protein